MSTTETQSASDSIPLKHGYELEVVQMQDTWRGKNILELRMIKPEMTTRERRNTPSVEVCPPFNERNYYHKRTWQPHQEPEWGHVQVDHSRMTWHHEAEVLAELVALAADLLRAMHEYAGERLDEQARLHAEYLAAELRAEEEKNAERNKLKEELQWFVGQKFKLRRDGYKATVFGVVDRFTDTHVYTTSERGVRMDTRIDAINFFAIMYEGERRYTTVFEREPKR